MQFGIGFDIHPLVAGRKLVLGGVEFPSTAAWTDGVTPMF